MLLSDSLRSALRRLNPSLPDTALEDAFRQVERIHAPELLAGNQTFHALLTEGVKVTVRRDGLDRGEIVWLIDFNYPENNEFLAVNQFTVIENRQQKRPDLVLFVNGLPLAVIELKNPADENATLESAFRQLQTYKQAVPSLFTYNELLIISDGLEARAGSLSAGFSRFMAWKTDADRAGRQRLSQLETLIRGMLCKQTLLDLVRSFIVFEQSKSEDPETRQTTIKTVKKLAACHQFYAVNKAVESTIRAAGSSGKGGVVWHTQGSGKSLSMVFFTGKIVLALRNPTVLVITDRNDLDDQLFDTFAAARQLLRQEPVQAESRRHLKELLQVGSGGVVFTTMQKFQPEEGSVYEQLSDRENIVVIADEAHRTQYGFQAKTVDAKDGQGNVIGKKTVYGFAKHLRDALPNAVYLGFTGTPIEKADKNTPAVFGGYVDVYDIAQAVADGSTVRIFYESRLAKISLTEEGQNLVRTFDESVDEGNDFPAAQQEKAKWTRLEYLLGSRERIRSIAQDIVSHFEQRQEAMQGKGMIVAMSRRIAAELHREIIALKPDWHHDDLDKGAVKVVMTAASSDGPELARHHTSKAQRRVLAERMRKPDDPLKLVIVRDMWLTGFDAPCLHTLYIDKPMKGHTLMQAIARVNRVYGDKPGGLIVDYLGIAADLKQALSFYADSGGTGDPAAAQEEAVFLLLEKLETVAQMLHGFDYEAYFTADTARKLALILEAEDRILGLENGRKRFLDEVAALSQAFALAVPHEKAVAVRESVAFFQAVKARLAKFSAHGSGSANEGLEAAVRQLIDKALTSEQVVDVFAAAGIRKPDVSILSEDFLLELRGMEHKNIALEVLKKLLNDEIRARTKKNLVQSSSLLEKLEKAISRYHSRIITAAQVIEELISLAKDIQTMDQEAEKMGLTDFEYAFYAAVASNKSAAELMRKEKLRELAVVLTEKVRANATIDWTVRESVRAKLKVIVKRTLRKYGYPPDMQELATETVLKQAELIAEELAAV